MKVEDTGEKNNKGKKSCLVPRLCVALEEKCLIPPVAAENIL